MPKTRRAPARHSLSSQLLDIIESRNLSAYALGKLAGVDPGVIQRFITGARDIRLETADRIGAALGLRLVEVTPRKATARARPPAAAADAGD